MKRTLLFLTATGLILGMVSLSGCASSHNKKRGCASNSASMGAERVLAGEKPEKKGKFKIKGMY